MPSIRIALRRRGALPLFAHVSLRDAHLAAFAWGSVPSKRTVYAKRNVGASSVYLHRSIMGLVPGDRMEVDHLNGDGLDCRRTNLRIVTRAQNMQNRPACVGSTSRHRGVSWDSVRRVWLAQVVVGGKRVLYARYACETDAAAAAQLVRAAHMTHANERR